MLWPVLALAHLSELVIQAHLQMEVTVVLSSAMMQKCGLHESKRKALMKSTAPCRQQFSHLQGMTCLIERQSRGKNFAMSAKNQACKQSFIIQAHVLTVAYKVISAFANICVVSPQEACFWIRHSFSTEGLTHAALQNDLPEVKQK